MSADQHIDIYRLADGRGGSLYELLSVADSEGALGDTYLVEPREGLVQRLVNRTVLRREVFVDRPHTDPDGAHALRARADSLGVEVHQVADGSAALDAEALLRALRRRVEAGRAFLLQKVGVGQPSYRPTEWKPRLFGWALVTADVV